MKQDFVFENSFEYVCHTWLHVLIEKGSLTFLSCLFSWTIEPGKRIDQSSDSVEAMHSESGLYNPTKRKTYLFLNGDPQEPPIPDSASRQCTETIFYCR